MKKALFVLFLSFITYLPAVTLVKVGRLSLITPIYAQPQSCSADKPYEIIPSCVVCGDVLFCYGNNYRLCSTDPRVPGPALGSRNESWYYGAGDFLDGAILYNGETFAVPTGGVYVCDSNVFGCANPACRGAGKTGPIPIDVGLDYDALACADFSVQGESTSEVIVPFPPPTGSDTYKGSVQGNISLEKLSFPDFSLPLLAARGYLAAITPDFYKNPLYSRSLSLPVGTLPLKFKHRLEGQPQDEKDNPSRTVSQTVTDVSYAPYVSANYALAALINYYEKGDALSSLNFTLPKFEPEIPPEGGSCPKSGETASIPIPDPSNLNPFFTATDITFHRSISAEPVRDEFGNILYYKRITQIETEDIEVESRSYLPSGKILEKKSDSLNSRLPFWVVEKEGQSSAQEGKFEVSLSGLGSETKQEEVKYSGMKAVYDRGCCLLHAIYPFQFKPKDCPCVSEP